VILPSLVGTIRGHPVSVRAATGAEVFVVVDPDGAG
jgi:hypothetical protein